ncbi:TIGR04222 domain-containing membrane protein [Rhodopirellula baltica]|uniref:TIGR04222 domain-containing membrane protein n=1 Tax=Rhodopirellula baltica WH47 TaxID=991778 RepID=F2AR26_RHOBT|nr:TIGR04222 domain-containing membrane protein [Rhodopirellula baltica]EGF27904.1 conserved hypothetical protein, membrane [Rhodopirellula baltica WH47]
MMKTTHENVTNDALWQKISHFPIGGESADWTATPPAQGLSFSQRLARENDWSIQHARRCIDEYRRFLYLAATAGHSVTPSDAVDQVWHQHLVYTENYWVDLCQDVLPSPLHHGPTKGGSQERVRYQDQYEQTLASYERAFGSVPVEVWPPTKERFAQSIASLRIDRRKFWLIPKPNLTGKALQGSHLAIAGLAATPFAALFPFNLDGPTFLALYGAAIVIGLVYLLVWFHITNGWSSNPSSPPKLGWGQLSILAGGKKRLLQTTLVALQKRGIVQCDQHGFTILDRGALQAQHDDDPVAVSAMKVTTDYLASSNAPQSFQRLLVAIHSTATNAESQMRESGLLRSTEQRNRFRVGGFSVAGILLVVGGLRCLQGIQNDRPIGFLVLEMILATVGLAVAFHMAGRERLTSLGQSVQERSQRSYPETGLKSTHQTDGGDLDELPSLACWGPAVAAYVLTDPSELFTNDMLYGEEIQAAQKASSSTGWIDWSSSDGGSSFDFSGGGGDAGCGGGCGGCGGCGG